MRHVRCAHFPGVLPLKVDLGDDVHHSRGLHTPHIGGWDSVLAGPVERARGPRAFDSRGSETHYAGMERAFLSHADPVMLLGRRGVIGSSDMLGMSSRSHRFFMVLGESHVLPNPFDELLVAPLVLAPLGVLVAVSRQTLHGRVLGPLCNWNRNHKRHHLRRRCYWVWWGSRVWVGAGPFWWRWCHRP